VCLKGTLFTPLSKKNTSTQSLNVQMRKDLGLGVNLVHGFSLPNVPTRHQDLDIVVIRWVTQGCVGGWGGVCGVGVGGERGVRCRTSSSSDG
jgi:isocitrate dehydrogenase (NAD+)